MTDIVERLRRHAQPQYPDDALTAAADEIERLRQEFLSEKRASTAAGAEIMRLRSALHDIVDGRGHDTGSAGARTIAAKALAGEPWE